MKRNTPIGMATSRRCTNRRRGVASFARPSNATAPVRAAPSSSHANPSPQPLCSPNGSRMPFGVPNRTAGSGLDHSPSAQALYQPTEPDVTSRTIARAAERSERHCRTMRSRTSFHGFRREHSALSTSGPSPARAEPADARDCSGPAAGAGVRFRSSADSGRTPEKNRRAAALLALSPAGATDRRSGPRSARPSRAEPTGARRTTTARWST